MKRWEVTPTVSGVPIILEGKTPFIVFARNKSHARLQGIEQADEINIIYDEFHIEELK